MRLILHMGVITAAREGGRVRERESDIEKRGGRGREWRQSRISEKCAGVVVRYGMDCITAECVTLSYSIMQESRWRGAGIQDIRDRGCEMLRLVSSSLQRDLVIKCSSVETVMQYAEPRLRARTVGFFTCSSLSKPRRWWSRILIRGHIIYFPDQQIIQCLFDNRVYIEYIIKHLQIFLNVTLCFYFSFK